MQQGVKHTKKQHMFSCFHLPHLAIMQSWPTLLIDSVVMTVPINIYVKYTCVGYLIRATSY